MSSVVVMATINLMNWWDAKTDKFFNVACVIFAAYDVHLAIITHYLYKGTKKNPDQTKIAYSMSRIDKNLTTLPRLIKVMWIGPSKWTSRTTKWCETLMGETSIATLAGIYGQTVTTSTILCGSMEQSLPKILPWLLWEQCEKWKGHGQHGSYNRQHRVLSKTKIYYMYKRAYFLDSFICDVLSYYSEW